MAYSYNRDNLLAGFSTTGGPVFTLNNVVVDGLGRLRDANETITKADQSHIQYSYTNQYDMRSQLTDANMTNVGGLAWVRDTYSYDKAGNVQSHSYDTSADPVVETPFSFDGDLMIEAGNTAVDWDWNGNMTAKDDAVDTTIEYNWDNKLRQATKGTESISIKYDPMGNRVYKSSSVNGNRKYIVDIASGLPTILLEIDTSDSSLKKSYVYANAEILCQHDGSSSATRYFYLHDRLGSVRQVINTDGSVVNYYTFEPFGKTMESGGTLSNPFLFTGQYYDSEIGQYYLRARQYDPQLMRFTGRDPVSGKFIEPMTLHRYLYCTNDPLNRIDPKGEFALTEVIIALFAVGNGVIQGNINVSFGPEDMSDKAKFWVGFTAGVLQMEVGMHFGAWAGSAVGSTVMSAGNAACSQSTDFFSVRTLINIGVNTTIGVLRDSMGGSISGWDIYAVGLFGSVTNKAAQYLYDDPYGTYGK